MWINCILYICVSIESSILHGMNEMSFEWYIGPRNQWTIAMADNLNRHWTDKKKERRKLSNTLERIGSLCAMDAHRNEFVCTEFHYHRFSQIYMPNKYCTSLNRIYGLLRSLCMRETFCIYASVCFSFSISLSFVANNHNHWHFYRWIGNTSNKTFSVFIIIFVFLIFRVAVIRILCKWHIQFV